MSLYGGSKDTAESNNMPTQTRKKEIVVKTNMSVLNLQDFDSLTLGEDCAEQVASIWVYGKMDCDPSNTDHTRTGTIYLYNRSNIHCTDNAIKYVVGGLVRPTTTESGAIGNIVSDKTGNFILINHSRDHVYADTQPLYVDGTVTLTGSEHSTIPARNKLGIGFNGQAVTHGDLVLVFSKPENAKAEQFVSWGQQDYGNNDNISVDRILNKIYLSTANNFLVENNDFSLHFDQVANDNSKKTLYYLSKFNSETGEFDKEPNWSNLEGRNGEKDVYIRRVVQRDYSHIPTLSSDDITPLATIPGYDKETSSVIFDYDSVGQNNVNDYSYASWLPDQGANAYISPGGKLTIKNFVLGSTHFSGSRTSHYFGIDRDHQVICFDSLVGNYYGWDWNWAAGNTTGFGRNMVTVLNNNKTNYYEHSEVQIKLADQDQMMPAYLLGYSGVGRYTIKAGKAEPRLDIQIPRFDKTVQIDTDAGDGTKGIVKFVTIRADSQKANNTEIEFKGSGTIQMSEVSGGVYVTLVE